MPTHGFKLIGSTATCIAERYADGSVLFHLPRPFWAGHAPNNARDRAVFERTADEFTVQVFAPRKKGDVSFLGFRATDGERCWLVTTTFAKEGISVKSALLASRPHEIYLARGVRDHDLVSKCGESAGAAAVLDYGAVAGVETPRMFDLRMLEGRQIARSLRLRPITMVEPQLGAETVFVQLVHPRGGAWVLEIVLSTEGVRSSLVAT
ncbi:MAG: hypothetical protein HYV34_01590 [Candidatus Kerfeldbacteria bacterium]|nr:hypothetical protein [Candidatus Kerfeldbacteria bacterium]